MQLFNFTVKKKINEWNGMELNKIAYTYQIEKNIEMGTEIENRPVSSVPY